MVDIVSLLTAGGAALVDYLSAHVLLCLVPAFFIAGALSALLKKEAVTKYLGPDTPKHISYPIAAVAGLLIAVCSCTILPLFAGIWKKGAGLGPAVTFLFTGPAINVLAIVYTGQLIGWDIAGARGVLAIAFGILIGLIMGFVFEKSKKDKSNGNGKTDAKGCAVPEVGVNPEKPDEKVDRRSFWLFVLLFAVLISGTLPIDLLYRLPFVAGFTVAAAVWTSKNFSRDESKQWMGETWFFVKTILPLLFAGVFLAGIFAAVIPQDVVVNYVGNNSLWANMLAVSFGIFMYFPTLVEVPVARMFLDLGMARGPLLAYLLADPELSLQSIFVVRKIMGTKKVLVYVGLVAVFCVLAGLIYGWVFG
ncbi:MAG: permease [Candidatus Thermoplasmatota archaeon]|nr:permease [Euryarchaeota archaeon]MBU4031834.1 permease [Candidatus Thermoplasmatota archaeon]MBU4071074.1 permease [Candidatus Thermoplasmatota archaeon]MBU4145187.1 permease [Candidatus Thermoplasmatota archaeon]MBU4591138.1 permease [Candidatus Thermoplasmatota archaeon]